MRPITIVAVLAALLDIGLVQAVPNPPTPQTPSTPPVKPQFKYLPGCIEKLWVKLEPKWKGPTLIDRARKSVVEQCVAAENDLDRTGYYYQQLNPDTFNAGQRDEIFFCLWAALFAQHPPDISAVAPIIVTNYMTGTILDNAANQKARDVGIALGAVFHAAGDVEKLVAKCGWGVYTKWGNVFPPPT